MNMRARPLVNGTPEFPICEIPMDSSFRDSPEILDCSHMSSLRWTVLVVSRFRDLRPPVTQILYQFESPVSEIPMDSRSPPRVLHGWTTQIYFGTFIVKFPDLSSSGLPESRSPKSRYQLLFRDFRLCSRGLNPHASPDRSNDCRVF
jgi:hypothetical protein